MNPFSKKDSPDQKSEFGFAERNAKSVLRSKIRFWIHRKEHALTELDCRDTAPLKMNALCKQLHQPPFFEEDTAGHALFALLRFEYQVRPIYRHGESGNGTEGTGNL